MPELPEVETYVRDLEQQLRGRRIQAATVRWPRTIAAPAVHQFEQWIQGQQFNRFGRRGKFMLLEMAGGATLIVHLRMTGRFTIEDGSAEADPHTHVVFDLDDGRRLFYRDARKFGRIWLVDDPAPVLRRLGPEPLDVDFDVACLQAGLAGRKASIKALLLDQSLVAGVGNIYADEALFRAGIHPAQAGGTLTPVQVAALHEAIRAVLAAGIEAKGSSLGRSGSQNYVRPTGDPGQFQAAHAVFRRTGQPCPSCGTPIERIVLAQRSTHFCPHCQPRQAEN